MAMDTPRQIGWVIGEVARVSATNTSAVSRDTNAASTSVAMNEAMKLGIDIFNFPESDVAVESPMTALVNTTI